MNWWMWTTTGTWACAIAAVACSFAVMRLIRFQSNVHKQTMTALNEMSDTYKQSWAIVCEDLNQLRDRIAELEER
jgi:hypothetical protein